MLGLFGTLNNSVKALNAQAKGVETAGRNLANVNNPSYARQRVLFGDRGTVESSDGPQSLGLEALGVLQIRDSLLDQQVCREISIKSELSSAEAGMQKAQAGLGQAVSRSAGTDATSATGSNGIAEAMSAFFNAFQSFAAKPTDVGERQTLIQRAGILSDSFQLTDARLAQTQADLSSEIKSEASSINGLLSGIAALNAQISRFELTQAGAAVDMRDSRQAKLEELAQKTSFEIRDIAGSNGQVQVITKDSSGNDVVLVDRGSYGSLSYNAGATVITATPVGGGAAATLAFSSGTIRGAMDTRDVDVQAARDNIDALAFQIVGSVNAAYAPSGASFFVPAGTSAGTLTVNPAITAASLKAGVGAIGDTSIASAIANLAQHTFSVSGGDAIDGTFSQFYSQTVTDIGQSLSGLTSRVDDQKTIEQLVRSQRDAISGVSLDEEMADLIKYQRAFQASSRVISTLDEMLNTIVNNMG
jgi:flagellar hook-associated protein 1 FlgK